MLDTIKGILNPSKLPATGPIEYRDLDLFLRWKFDETSGTTVNDSSPLALNPGVYYNSPTLNQPGLSFHTNKSVYFDSASLERAEGSLSQPLGSSWSVSFWVNLTTISGNPRILTLSKSSGAAENLIEIAMFAGVISIYGFLNNVLFRMDSAAGEFLINTTYNLTITCSETNGARLYKNAVFKSLSVAAGDSNMIKNLYSTGINNLCVGCARRLGPSYLVHSNGNIDDCSVWNRELTFAEVTRLYTVGLP